MNVSLKPVDHGAFSWLADEECAQRYLEKIRWPDGIVCPHCACKGRVGRLNGGSTRLGTYKCYACRKSFSITHGTIFSASHVPVHKWLQAIYLTEGGANPIRPHHLHRILNVSFKTAASMVRRLADAGASNRALEPSEIRPAPSPLQALFTAPARQHDDLSPVAARRPGGNKASRPLH
jgi:transposase-like protein